MIKEKLLRYAPVIGFLGLAAAFLVVRGLPALTCFIYSMLVVGGVSIGQCALDIVGDVFSIFRKPKKFAKVLPDLEGVKKNEG